jgi:flavin reductase (DIM6/NTAB) family NADH-FMN oxidoreductase RutF
LTAAKGIQVKAPHIEECPVHVECETVYRDQMEPGELKKAIEDEVYTSKDLHAIYYGEIKGMYEVEGARGKLL